MTEAILDIGTKMADGSIFAGLTPDGTKQIFAMPKDLTTMLGFTTMTFNKAAKRVAKLNADNTLGHDDWQIPSLENLHVLQKNQNEGALEGTFSTESEPYSGYPAWYWSSTPGRNFPSSVDIVRFTNGFEYWDTKDNLRLFCRPMRLVACKSP